MRRVLASDGEVTSARGCKRFEPKAVRILAVPAFHGFGITNAPSRSCSARNTLYLWSLVTVAILRIESRIVSFVHTPVVLFRAQLVVPGRLTSETEKVCAAVNRTRKYPPICSSKTTEKAFGPASCSYLLLPLAGTGECSPCTLPSESLNIAQPPHGSLRGPSVNSMSIFLSFLWAW